MVRKLAKLAQELVVGPFMRQITALEDGIVAMPEARRSVADSPARFEIMQEGMKGGINRRLSPEVTPLMPPTILGMRRSMASLKKNPAQPKTRAPDGFLADLERYARSLGVSSVGYTRAPERWIFQDKAILHLNAIVLTMEMDKVRIDTAPSVAGEQAVIQIYRDLGIVVNKIAAYLRKRGWKGFVLPIPNCTTTGLVVALAPLAAAFGVRSVVMTSLQALSGAGRSPGVIALDVLDNVIPFIPKEEEKVQTETSKILGSLEGERIVPLDLPVSATCTRVNVRDGHTEAVTAGLGRPAALEEVAEAMRSFGRDFVGLGLPSSPPELIQVTTDPYRPQPRVDRSLNDGMTTVVGRIRGDAVFENGIRFVLLSHNTKMGAAKGAVLLAEYVVEQGLA